MADKEYSKSKETAKARKPRTPKVPAAPKSKPKKDDIPHTTGCAACNNTEPQIPGVYQAMGPASSALRSMLNGMSGAGRAHYGDPDDKMNPRQRMTKITMIDIMDTAMDKYPVRPGDLRLFLMSTRWEDSILVSTGTGFNFKSLMGGPNLVKVEPTPPPYIQACNGNMSVSTTHTYGPFMIPMRTPISSELSITPNNMLDTKYCMVNPVTGYLEYYDDTILRSDRCMSMERFTLAYKHWYTFMANAGGKTSALMYHERQTVHLINNMLHNIKKAAEVIEVFREGYMTIVSKYTDAVSKVNARYLPGAAPANPTVMDFEDKMKLIVDFICAIAEMPEIELKGPDGKQVNSDLDMPISCANTCEGGCMSD